MDKRTFIKNVSLLGFAGMPGINNLDKWIAQYEKISPGEAENYLKDGGSAR